MPGRERGKYLYPHRAHHPGKGARTGGARDDGRRQADQGIARLRSAAGRRAFLLPRRLGGQTRLRVPRPQSRARSACAGRSSRGISRCSWPRGNSRPRSPAATPWCSSPRRRRSITALHLAQILQEAELPDGVVNIVTGAGETGARARRASGRGQDRVHRLDRSRQDASRKPSPASNKKLTLELGGKAAHIVFEDAPIDQAVEGVVAASSSIRATSAAPARGCSCRKASSRRCCTSCATASPRCASAIRSTRTPTSARSIRKPQLEKIRELVERGVERRRRADPAALRAAASADIGFRRASSPASPRAIAWRRRKSSARC